MKISLLDHITILSSNTTEPTSHPSKHDNTLRQIQTQNKDITTNNTLKSKNEILQYHTTTKTDKINIYPTQIRKNQKKKTHQNYKTQQKQQLNLTKKHLLNVTHN